MSTLQKIIIFLIAIFAVLSVNVVPIAAVQVRRQPLSLSAFQMSHQQGGSDVTNPVHLLTAVPVTESHGLCRKCPMYVAFMVPCFLFLSFTTAVRLAWTWVRSSLE